MMPLGLRGAATHRAAALLLLELGEVVLVFLEKPASLEHILSHLIVLVGVNNLGDVDAQVEIVSGI